jgi:hypothetical protein
MTTVGDLINLVTPINNNLIILQDKIPEYYDNLKNETSVDLAIKNEIADYEAKSDSYDRLFQEKEAELQRNGQRGRGQTLQEYCLLFFYVCYALFASSLILYSSTSGMWGGIKMLVLTVLFLVPITGLIMFYG